LIKNSSIPKFFDREIEANIKKDLDKYSDFEAKDQIKGRYSEGKGKISGIDFSKIFADFE